MVNCEIYEDIGKGQCNKQKYRIWSLWKRESSLLYWYVILFDSTYNAWMDMSAVESVKKENELTDKAIDIRKLANYKELKSTDIIFNRDNVVVPLIKEAVRKGYVKPV